MTLRSSRDCLTALNWEQTFTPTSNKQYMSNNSEDVILQSAVQQIIEYFLGQRQIFDIPLCIEGTNFQKRVWATLQTIPYGYLVSYKTLAKMMDMPGAQRAIGTACKTNPISIIIPCHRVVCTHPSTKKIQQEMLHYHDIMPIDQITGGYAGGVKLKKKLLQLESKVIRNSS